MTERPLPKIGTAVWIRREGKVLMGRRTREGEGEKGTWCPPGGHLEMNEKLEECIAREAREEAGVEVENIRYLVFTENINRKRGKHYVTFFFAADWKSGQLIPEMAEFDRLKWFEWGKLPEPVFYPTKLFLDTGINPFEV